MIHDPIDSLLYLHKTLALSLDGLSEEMSQRFGFSDENEDVKFLDGWIEGIKATVYAEAKAQFDGRPGYSTGVPFYRTYAYPSYEPGEHGETVMTEAEATVVMHPSGEPKEPPEKRGRWID